MQTNTSQQSESQQELDTRFNDASTCKAFIRTLHANLENDKMTDAEFRQFVRNCLYP